MGEIVPCGKLRVPEGSLIESAEPPFKSFTDGASPGTSFNCGYSPAIPYAVQVPTGGSETYGSNAQAPPASCRSVTLA